MNEHKVKKLCPHAHTHTHKCSHWRIWWDLYLSWQEQERLVLCLHCICLTLPNVSLLCCPSVGWKMFSSVKAFEGQHYSTLKRQCLQSGHLFEDPLFPAVDDSLFYQGNRIGRVHWKRPRVSAQKSLKSHGSSFSRWHREWDVQVACIACGSQEVLKQIPGWKDIDFALLKQNLKY